MAAPAPKPEPGAIVLAADVGGTHLNLALAEITRGRPRILRRHTAASQGETSLLAPIRRFLDACLQADPALRPVAAALAGAGPVRGTCIALTNLPWEIDGASLSDALDMPVHVLNDFSALTRGVALMDPGNPGELLPVPRMDGSRPSPHPEGTLLVVGAGTGLGVGFATREGNRLRVHPSEGGHGSLPILDAEGLELWAHLESLLGGPPEAETCVSGPGLASLFGFFAPRMPANPVADRILTLPAQARPAAIASHADDDPVCARTMEAFIALFAEVCAGLCAAFLPTGGLYLAGGIAAKNPGWFLEGGRFRRAFERGRRPPLDAITRATPIFLVRDYGTSLLGAAAALEDQLRTSESGAIPPTRPEAGQSSAS